MDYVSEAMLKNPAHQSWDSDIDRYMAKRSKTVYPNMEKDYAELIKKLKKASGDNDKAV